MYGMVASGGAKKFFPAFFFGVAFQSISLSLEGIVPILAMTWNPESPSLSWDGSSEALSVTHRRLSHRCWASFEIAKIWFLHVYGRQVMSASDTCPWISTQSEHIHSCLPCAKLPDSYGFFWCSVRWSESTSFYRASLQGCERVNSGDSGTHLSEPQPCPLRNW